VFEHVKPYIAHFDAGAAEITDYDEGGNRWRSQVGLRECPAPDHVPLGESPAQTASFNARCEVGCFLEDGALGHARMLLHPHRLAACTLRQAHWLATLPFHALGEHAEAIYNAIEAAVGHNGLVPIDNRRRARREHEARTSAEALRDIAKDFKVPVGASFLLRTGDRLLPPDRHVDLVARVITEAPGTEEIPLGGPHVLVESATDGMTYCHTRIRGAAGLPPGEYKMTAEHVLDAVGPSGRGIQLGATVLAPCWVCGKDVDREDCLCHGCGEVICADCDPEGLFGSHAPDDHLPDPEGEE